MPLVAFCKYSYRLGEIVFCFATPPHPFLEGLLFGVPCYRAHICPAPPGTPAEAGSFENWSPEAPGTPGSRNEHGVTTKGSQELRSECKRRAPCQGKPTKAGRKPTKTGRKPTKTAENPRTTGGNQANFPPVCVDQLSMARERWFETRRPLSLSNHCRAKCSWSVVASHQHPPFA